MRPYKPANKQTDDCFRLKNLAHAGNLEELKKLVYDTFDKGEHFAFWYRDSISAAINAGHLDVVTFMVDVVKEYEVPEDKMGPASFSLTEQFIHACHKGETAIAEALLDRGAQIHAALNRQFSPESDEGMYQALYWGHTDTVKMLHNRGAKGHKNWGLVHASDYGYADLLSYLLERDKFDQATLDKALVKGIFQMDEKADQTDHLRHLLDHGANIHASNDEALKICMRQSTAEFLVNHGADLLAVKTIMEQAIQDTAKNGGWSKIMDPGPLAFHRRFIPAMLGTIRDEWEAMKAQPLSLDRLIDRSGEIVKPTQQMYRFLSAGLLEEVLDVSHWGGHELDIATLCANITPYYQTTYSDVTFSAISKAMGQIAPESSFATMTRLPSLQEINAMLHGKIQTHLAADYPNGAPDMVRLNDLRQGDAPLLDEVEQDWLRRQGLLNQSPNPVLSLKALAELANGTGRSSLGQVAGR